MAWAIWKEYPDDPEAGRLYHGYGAWGGPEADWRSGIENAEVYYDSTEAYNTVRHLRKHKPPDWDIRVRYGVERMSVKRLTLRIPPGLDNQVKVAAEVRGMNVNQFIINCLDAQTPKE